MHVHPAAVERRDVADGAELTHAVSLNHLAAQAFCNRMAEVGVERRRPGHDDVEGGQVVLIDEGMLGQGHRDRWCDESDRAFVFGDVAEELAEVVRG